MPKKKVVKEKEPVNEIQEEDVRLTENTTIKLSITDSQIDNVVNSEKDTDIEPTAYEPRNIFVHESEMLPLNNDISGKHICCMNCTYQIEGQQYSIPMMFNENTKQLSNFGYFCSLQCASRYNYEKNNKSERFGEINSYINMIAHTNDIKEVIRPAPSKDVLTRYGGTLSIEDYRQKHITGERTYMLNIQPMSMVKTSVEVINTSYIIPKRKKQTIDSSIKIESKK